MSSDELYQKVILEHYKNPRNFGELSGDCISGERDNPVCGDQVKVMLKVDRGRVGEIKFSARGCALSIASASMMTELILNKPVEEAASTVENIIDIFQKKQSGDQLENYGDFSALKGVFAYPVRIKCVLLCWHALEDALPV
jgi:nitrogen fixation NifU-like protein